jgi:hypothetical protein
MTTKHTIEISKIDPYGHRVLLDGTDIANSINGLTITMRAGLPASVELSLPIIDVTEIQDAEARILIPDTTRDTLTALGWTPPADELAPDTEPAPDPLPPYIDIKAYRTDDGRNAWVFRCWGDGDCDGELHLDLDNQPYAQHKARRHIAAAHTVTVTES